LIDAVVVEYGVERVCAATELATIPEAEASVYLDLLEQRPVSGALLEVESIRAFRNARACPPAGAGPASSIP